MENFKLDWDKIIEAHRNHQNIHPYLSEHFRFGMIEEIRVAIDDGLTKEWFELLTSKYMDEQFKELKKAFLDGLTIDQVKLFFNPKRDYVIMKIIRKAYKKRGHLSKKELDLLLDTRFEWNQISELSLALEENPVDVVEIFAHPDFSPYLMRDIMEYLRYNNGDLERLRTIVKFLLDNVNSYRIDLRICLDIFTVERDKPIEKSSLLVDPYRIETIVMAFTRLTREQFNIVTEVIEVNSKNEFKYSEERMRTLVLAYRKYQFNSEQMQFLLNPNFDRFQINQIMDAFIKGFTIDQVKSFANPDIDSREMEERKAEISKQIYREKIRNMSFR